MLPLTKYLDGIEPTAWSFPLAARVIHFGADDCHRLMVLRTAGYSVDDCPSLVQLRESLAKDAATDALLMSDAEGVLPNEAIALARTKLSVPVILFRSTTLAYQETGVDLIVHPLTPPEIWLPEVEALIERSRVIRARAETLAGQAAQLRRESAAAREWSRAERARSRREYVRNTAFSPTDPFVPKSGAK